MCGRWILPPGTSRRSVKPTGLDNNSNSNSNQSTSSNSNLLNRINPSFPVGGGVVESLKGKEKAIESSSMIVDESEEPLEGTGEEEEEETDAAEALEVAASILPNRNLSTSTTKSTTTATGESPNKKRNGTAFYEAKNAWITRMNELAPLTQVTGMEDG